MSVVSFTFGSFGDIATLLQLAWNVRRTLHGAAEASEDIQDAIASVDSFTLALQSVKSTIEAEPHMPPARFYDFCARNSFALNPAHPRERGVLQHHHLLAESNVEVWFQYFVYDDPTMFARESVLVSPVFLKRGHTQTVSRQYSSALRVSSENGTGPHTIIIEGENESDHELTVVSGERLVIWSGCVVVPVESSKARRRRHVVEHGQKPSGRRLKGKYSGRVGHRQ
ncbi:hypothetical protein AURDEDRAFT_183958 [Auricularia subglabra TFB-10046 SS5]|nr:hypothetical protein AURDEDRAFT_183958 [Auricularia subglabra TFB-10046 SS5]